MADLQYNSGGAASAPAPGAPEVENELWARSRERALSVEVNATLVEATDVQAALESILGKLLERAGLSRAAVYVLDAQSRVLRGLAESGSPRLDAGRAWGLDGPGLVPWAGHKIEAVYAPDVGKDRRALCQDPSTRSEYAVPLCRGEALLGVLDVQSSQRDGIRAVTRKLVDHTAAQIALLVERGELDQKLKDAEARFRAVFEHSDLGVALCTLEGRFSSVNPAFGRLLGYAPEELRGRHYTDVTHPEDRASNLKQTPSPPENGQDSARLERKYLRKSGEVVVATTALATIGNAAGHPAFLLMTLADRRRERKTEEECARLREQLDRAQKMEAVGTLAGGLAHDFNNSLGVILGFASLARERLRLEDPLQEPLRMIEASARSAGELTRQLLGLMREGRRERVLVNVEEVVRRVAKIASHTFDRRIRVETRLAPDLPTVEAEAGQLEQALLNLCINGRDAMPDGGQLTLETSLVRLQNDSRRPARCAPGDYVRMAVRDTGLGIEPQALPRLFEPLFTTKGPGRGSGLGLMRVRRIAEGNGGFVRVESEVVHGSEFSLYLPAAGGRPEPVRVAEPAGVEYGSGTVLVVDDEPLVLTFAQRGLEKLGYRVVAAESGRRACEIYAGRAKEIDYVLLDMVMPEVSGVETYHKLRQINPQVRIILSSGFSQDRVARDVLRMGAAEFIGKPYSLETLSLALKKAQAG